MNHPDVVKQAMQDRAFQQALAQVPDQYREAIAQAAVANQIVFKRDAYYSKVRAQYTVSKAMTTSTFTLAKGYQAVAFGYGLNDNMTSAGFPASIGYDAATLADTNLFKGGETNAAELELIQGIGVILSPDSDPLLAKRTLHQCYLSGGVNGNTNDFKWGQPGFYPAGSGFYGLGSSLLALPSWAGELPEVGAMSNGIPGSEDWSREIDPILWGPKGQADSTFQAVLTVQRAISFTVTDRAAGAMGVQPAAWTAPAAPNAGPVSGEGTYLDITIRLFGAQFAPRGRNR